MHQTSDKIT